MNEKLPKLNAKQNECLKTFVLLGCSQIEAYSSIYGENSNKNTLYKDASKFFHSPKIIPWLKYYRENTEKAIQEELNYTAREHFDELNNLKSLALECRDKYSNPDIKTMLKAEELKGRMAGLYKNDIDEISTQVTVMGNIKLNGEDIKLKVGSETETK